MDTTILQSWQIVVLVAAVLAQFGTGLFVALSDGDLNAAEMGNIFSKILTFGGGALGLSLVGANMDIRLGDGIENTAPVLGAVPFAAYTVRNLVSMFNIKHPKLQRLMGDVTRFLYKPKA